jgi:hypothetical protein
MLRRPLRSLQILACALIASQVGVVNSVHAQATRGGSQIFTSKAGKSNFPQRNASETNPSRTTFVVPMKGVNKSTPRSTQGPKELTTWNRAILPRRVILHVDQLLKGDREFAGNGPHISLHTGIGHSDRQIWLHVHMSAEEAKDKSKPGWSKGSGARTIVFYHAPGNMKIRRVTGPKFQPIGRHHVYKRIEYTDTDHAVDRFSHDWGTVHIVGDSRGKDINRKTRAEFRDIQYVLNVELESLTN